MKYDELKAKNLPDTPGVYFFLGPEKDILYIGKATSLRDRTKSYFKDDVIKTRGPLIVDMVTKAVDIDFIETDSVLDALMLEAVEIKKYQPHYNSREKDDKSYNVVVITKEDFPLVQVVRNKDFEEHFPKKKVKHVFGPYPQGLLLKEGLKIIRRIFPYRDQKCEPGQGKPCFNRQIGLCPGVCTGEITKTEYSQTIQNIRLFFEGKKGTLLKKLEQQMKLAAKAREFERANDIKKTIFALTHIQDVSLIRAETAHETPSMEHPVAIPGTEPKPVTFRIEAYDIAHMSGKNTAGVMVVLENRHIKKSDYRLFKIRHAQGVNDIAGLKETLNRRLNHSEWPYPNLIVVDGSIAQINATKDVLRERGFDIGIVAVVKNEKHRAERILGDEAVISKYKKEILLVNSEAHRFAIKYHRKLRSKIV